MLRAILPLEDELAQRRFRDLGGQEWIDIRDGFLQIDANLLGRLFDFYRKREPRLLERTAALLAPDLDRLARRHLEADSLFDQRTTRLLDAALRLLPPGQAAALWDLFERRLIVVRNWSAAQLVCEFLLGSGNAAGDDEAPLRAAVRATLIATRIHTSRDYKPARDWMEVLTSLPLHPDPVSRRWLEARARLGRPEFRSNPLDQRHGEYTPAEIMELIGPLWSELDEWQAEQVRGAICAYLEDDPNRAKPSHYAIVALFETAAGELDYYVMALVYGRGLWDPPDLGDTTPQRWLDWRAPASIRDRARLIATDPAFNDNALLEERFHELRTHIRTIDADRLASGILGALLDRHPVPADLIASISPDDLYDPDRIPTCDAHRVTPPLFQSVADAMIANGDGDGALALAGRVRDRAQANQDAPSAEAAELIRWRVIRRFRLPDAMGALNKLVPHQHPGATAFHYRWATASAGSPQEAHALIDGVPHFDKADLQGPAGEIDPHTTFDLIEAEQIATRLGAPREIAPRDVPDGRWLVQVGGLRALLRSAALGQGDLPEHFENARPRHLAEVAFEEGELLVLRLPDRALWLFSTAHAAYVRASDPVGETLTALSASLAAFKAGTIPQARRWFEHAEAAFGRMMAVGVALPAWETLSPATIQQQRTSAWYPWLLRIGLINARLTEGVAGGPLTVETQQIITRFLGDDGHPDFSLRAFADVPAPAPAAVDREWVPWLSAMAGATLLAAVGFGIYHGIASIGAAILLGVIPVVGLAVLLTAAGNRWLARTLVKADRIRIDISMKKGDRSRTMILSKWFGPMHVVLLNLHSGQTLEDAETPTFGMYQLQADARVDRPITRELQRLHGRLGAAPIVPLYVDDAVAHHSWEAVLALSLKKTGENNSGETVSFVRPAAPLPKPPLPEAPPLRGLRLVAPNELAVTFAPCWPGALNDVLSSSGS